MIALISDIHGNFVALNEVLKEIDRLGVKEIYCLGDVAGYYLQINECCEELIKRDVKCVLGNHDWHLISGTESRSKTANTCLKFQRNIITTENLKWLASFPVYRRFGELALVHGGWGNPIYEYLVEPTADYFEGMPNQYFASGHTHKQLVKSFQSKKYCNPGSVGQPRDGDSRSAFCFFNENEFSLKRVEYDIEEICNRMLNAGFNDYYYRRLRTGAENFI